MPAHEPLSMAWLEQRSIPEPNSGCWLWTGHWQLNGYGGAKTPRTRFKTGAHRLAYEIANGPIPTGLVVCHKCDTRCCVNPAHLSVGTQMQNLRDCVAKGRHSHGLPRSKMLSGEGSAHSRLTWPQVRAIREASPNTAEQGRIAARLGVTRANIRLILRNKSWKHDPLNKESN